MVWFPRLFLCGLKTKDRGSLTKITLENETIHLMFLRRDNFSVLEYRNWMLTFSQVSNSCRCASFQTGTCSTNGCGGETSLGACNWQSAVMREVSFRVQWSPKRNARTAWGHWKQTSGLSAAAEGDTKGPNRKWVRGDLMEMKTKWTLIISSSLGSVEKHKIYLKFPFCLTEH